jgi:protein-disulfide isomerase
MIDENEFSDVTEALGRYRPIAPDPANRPAIAPIPQSRRRWRWPATIAAAVLAAVAFWAWQANHQPSPQVQSAIISPEFSQAWLKQARQVLPWDTPKKPVVVTVFVDWQCVGCFVLDQNLIQVLEKLERIFPGRITVVFEDWPFDPSCNAGLRPGSTLIHEGSCELARAVRRARERGRDAELIAWLRDHQNTWRDVGLPAEFRVNATDGAAAVQDSIARGQRVKITSTPTMFINGVRISQMMPARELEWAFRLELARASAQ